MPHSSGGGSHGGGSHGGFHGGSHGGSHGSYRRRPRMMRRYFPGSRRYMYHDRYGMPCYIYSDTQPKPMSLTDLAYLIPIIFCSIYLLVQSIGMVWPVQALNPIYGEVKTHINDTIDVIDNEPELEESLRAFQKKTGICPYVMTVYDEDWLGKYSSLERYSYQLYVKNFEDEQHFLVVYSESSKTKKYDFNDWRWEGMQGNDTDPILTPKNFSLFQADLQKYLTMDSVSVGDAFNRTFTNSLSYIMKKDNEQNSGWFVLGTSVLFCAGAGIIVCMGIKRYKDSKRPYQEVPLGDTDRSSDNQWNGHS